jgi:hypothetical protein
MVQLTISLLPEVFAGVIVAFLSCVILYLFENYTSAGKFIIKIRNALPGYRAKEDKDG